MASVSAQRKWRAKNKLVKRQLNIMARKQIHEQLDEIARRFDLRGKGEAVTFSVYLAMGLIQQADFNPEAGRLLDILATSYHRDRDLYAP